jgi:aryl-alcohol dehydrogenase-like predicted oxidoreductase
MLKILSRTRRLLTVALAATLMTSGAMAQKTQLLVYSALAFGHLTGKYLRGGKPSDARLVKFGPLWPRYARPQIEPAVLRYEALAKDAGLTLTQLALAFCYRSPYVASTILGATSVEQLREQIDAWSVPLSDDLVKAIDAVHEQMTNPAR